MAAMVLACGRGAEVAPAALAGRAGVTVRNTPGAPGRDDVDPVLSLVGADREYDRMVVLGEDADLAAVVVRLLRRGRLTVPVGFVPVSARSAAVANWGLPVHGDDALDVALGAEPMAVPLVRDDTGGVLVGAGRLGPVRGVAYCDETQVLRGPARSIRVTPHRAGVAVAVAPTGWFRTPYVSHGRAFEVGCVLPTAVVKDGVAHHRPVLRWTWYRHTQDLLLIGPG
jgi:hypothetical protein